MLLRVIIWGIGIFFLFLLVRWAFPFLTTGRVQAKIRKAQANDRLRTAEELREARALEARASQIEEGTSEQASGASVEEAAKNASDGAEDPSGSGQSS